MRTAIIIVLGFLLWGVCIGTARIWNLASATAATVVFVLLWFIAAGANLWMGVTKAGYSLREELPIFLLIFALPVLLAILVNWRSWSR